MEDLIKANIDRFVINKFEVDIPFKFPNELFDPRAHFKSAILLYEDDGIYMIGCDHNEGIKEGFKFMEPSKMQEATYQKELPEELDSLFHQEMIPCLAILGMYVAKPDLIVYIEVTCDYGKNVYLYHLVRPPRGSARTKKNILLLELVDFTMDVAFVDDHINHVIVGCIPSWADAYPNKLDYPNFTMYVWYSCL